MLGAEGTCRQRLKELSIKTRLTRRWIIHIQTHTQWFYSWSASRCCLVKSLFLAMWVAGCVCERVCKASWDWKVRIACFAVVCVLGIGAGVCARDLTGRQMEWLRLFPSWLCRERKHRSEKALCMASDIQLFDHFFPCKTLVFRCGSESLFCKSQISLGIPVPSQVPSL